MKSATSMALEEIGVELRALKKRWKEFRSDPDQEGYGGSPGEWMVERMDELDTELRRRRSAAR